ncbi:flagellar hook-associated protein FlgL [Spongisporangium articulatum]|uniref:Flagellar hook-associated protein FlgL n=1 Tax=Spongisporangium articulatum TaxID=3362603 RepID=A0ABW8AHL4_9ACTN
MALSRVTQTTMTNSTLRGLQASQLRAANLQNELSTNKKLTKPSDDPAALANTMQLRTELAQDNQYLDTIGDASDRLQAADSALQDTSSLLNRAKALIVNSQNASLDDAGRNAIATELDAIRQSVISNFNATYQGRPVFGGTIAGSQAVDPDTGAYVGNDEDISVRAGRNVNVRVDVKGSTVGADVLPDLLAKTAADIRSGSTDVTDDQNQLDAAMKKVTTSLGDIGARVNQLQSTKTRITAETTDLTARISGLEDIDLAETIMELTSAQTSYQSALGAAGKIMQTSLLDYLR